MSRESLVFLTGFIVFIAAFAGFPREWEQIVFVVSGIVLMMVGYSLRRTAFFRSIEGGHGEHMSDSFTEKSDVPGELEDRVDSKE